MFAERYLAKRYMQGKREGYVIGWAQGYAIGKAQGIARILALLDEDKRREVERKLRLDSDLHGST